MTIRNLLLGAALAALASAPSRLAAGEPEVLVILWFDTEDYLLEASDDAALRVAEILTERSIRGTFKLVGEKARVLEKRGRSDVIQALKKHDLGYHANFHSVHPTPSEYLAECGFADGVAEFVRREGPGAGDVRRIFGVETLSCYGQPGSSWAPQTMAGLRSIGVAPHGVPTYVDEGTHVGLNGKPFWYCGALTVYHLAPNVTRMDLHRDGGLEEGCRRFQEIHQRLRAEGGGLISIYYHPAEWVHRQFWDGVNFSRGANPPREEWKRPPQRPREESELAYQRFEKYLDFQRPLPGVKYVTASDLPLLYPDRLRSEGVDLDTARAMAKAIAAGGKADLWKDERGRHYSPADQFAALTGILGRAIEEGKLPERVEVPEILGPAETAPETPVEELPWPAFRDTVREVRDALRVRRQIPSPVFAGVRKIAPADFLLAEARVFLELEATPEGPPEMTGELRFPRSVRLPKGTPLATERFVAADTPELFGGWVIHLEGFRAPRILEAARLQSWTLKPASR